MATQNQKNYRQVYNASDDVSILAGVSQVYCIFSRRALLTAALNADGSLLSVHYTAYGPERVAWDLDFFEQLFTQEPMLADRSKISRVFFNTNMTMVVPDELYDRDMAAEWLGKVHFIDQADTIRHYQLTEDKAWYVYGLPLNIEALIKINCSTAVFAPVAAYQFTGNYTRGVRLHCFLTADEATISLLHYGTLLWHSTITYSEPEDIAYEIRLVCEEHKINADKISISCTTLTAAEHATMAKLAQYFGSYNIGSGHNDSFPWSPVISLIQQLQACA
jgi:hypothetical protein